MKQLLTTFFYLFSLTLSAQTVKVFYDENSNSIVFGKSRYNMIHISSGSFIMGATPEQEEYAEEQERPAHKVTLSDYYIGQTEVTQTLWEAVMGDNPSYFKGKNLPVENVSWDECQIFIEKLNACTGRTFRLPTEAEWEFAARGGNKSHGYMYSGSNNFDNVAWYYMNSKNKTHPIATKQANELGLYDMSGNVYEWCYDCYNLYNSYEVNNPCDTDTGYGRVGRGGSWDDGFDRCRVSYRLNFSRYNRYEEVGLRLVLVPSSSQNKSASNPEQSTQVQQKVSQSQPTVVSNSKGSENGLQYVDLGLSVKWATCNVGANSPEGYGDYFAWGETCPKTNYNIDWSNYFDSVNGSKSNFNKYAKNKKTKLDLSDDAAHVNWGGSWRMPTRAEQDELRTKCIWTWTTQNGVKGRKATGPNGNFIFLPAAGIRLNRSLLESESNGNYWSSSLNPNYFYYAYYLGFDSGDVDWHSFDRFLGQNIRAVHP